MIEKQLCWFEEKKNLGGNLSCSWIWALVWFLQSFTKYLRQTLLSYEIGHYGKKLISVFQEIFASIAEIFISWGGIGTKQ